MNNSLNFIPNKKNIVKDFIYKDKTAIFVAAKFEINRII
ncbi:hypothetical protein KL86DYS2_12108 [uncultured Dysgonomonas sp.]|uniref:Uncharacterized protein n=1 Tax=uncultured Dysgonomonas sp. TaxID=206096 RepID=A0A212JQL8_9BACT|nr:hypothetical protein KL86DYS2_12108 [uncultured Dysgonomonas sp.]